jgi:3-oxoacyl-[acyl-carrier-protein] synthase II
MERVVVTGLGVVSPVGTGVERFWAALRQGVSGVRPISLFDARDLPSRIAGEVVDFCPEDFLPRKEARRLDRATQFAVAAARMALRDAALDPAAFGPEDIGVVFGLGVGQMGTFEAEHGVLLREGPRRVSPFFIANVIPNMPACQIAIQCGLQGPVVPLTSACSTGTDCIGQGAELIRRGLARAVVAGGTEAPITPLTVAGFANARALSRRNDCPAEASCPFDRRRDGFVIGEGAGAVVLEALSTARARGARIYAEVLGYGTTCDAFHITAPPEDGGGLVRAMRLALRQAGLPPEAIDYLNAHGTATPLNDKIETRAIKTVFGDHARRLPISSTKSMTGHLLGAAGAVEFVATVLSLRDGFVHPTINLHEPDPECDLDYVPLVGRPAPLRVAMTNSLAFGGQNASLVVARWDGSEDPGRQDGR